MTSRFDAAIVSRIHDLANEIMADPRASEALRNAAGDVVLESDRHACMREMVALLVAAEDAADWAKSLHERARAVMHYALEESGAPAIRNGIHSATLAEGRANVIITNPEQIPPGFMKQPPPTPDKDAIARAIKAGERVPGAELRNSRPHVRVNTRRDAA